MKIALLAPNWGNIWKPSLQKAFADAGHKARWFSTSQELGTARKWSDRCLSMWADQLAIEMSYTYDKPFFTYIRAYEAFTDMPASIRWDNVQGLFFCNNNTVGIVKNRFDAIIDQANYRLMRHIVLNWIEIKKYPFKKRENGTKIAMVCDLNFKKNIPLAIQIMTGLPKEYTLDIAGRLQDFSLLLYLDNLVFDLGLGNRICIKDRIPHKKIPAFLDDKNYIMSTSMREGCPMNILEGMAMGLKPIIHNWPGAKDLFPGYVFSDLSSFLPLLVGDYDSALYRGIVEKSHGLENAKKVVEIVTQP